jgi:hypothetical protein
VPVGRGAAARCSVRVVVGTECLNDHAGSVGTEAPEPSARRLRALHHWADREAIGGGSDVAGRVRERAPALWACLVSHIDLDGCNRVARRPPPRVADSSLQAGTVAAQRVRGGTCRPALRDIPNPGSHSGRLITPAILEARDVCVVRPQLKPPARRTRRRTASRPIPSPRSSNTCRSWRDCAIRAS